MGANAKIATYQLTGASFKAYACIKKTDITDIAKNKKSHTGLFLKEMLEVKQEIKKQTKKKTKKVKA